MKSYGELKARIRAIQQQMTEAKTNQCANAQKELRHFYKEFSFTAGILKGSLTVEWK